MNWFNIWLSVNSLVAIETDFQLWSTLVNFIFKMQLPDCRSEAFGQYSRAICSQESREKNHYLPGEPSEKKSKKSKNMHSLKKEIQKILLQ